MNEVVLQATNITKRYNDKEVLSNVNLKLHPGEICGFVGQNGAGKTTFMKIVCGLVKADSGDIYLSGKNQKKEKSNLGVLLEQPALYPHLNARDNLRFFSKIFGLKDEKLRIEDVLKLVGLGDEEKKLISEYSLGMKQRLGLAITLINNPSLLILDEPINGLDPHGIIEIRKILLNLVKERQITILISSHILAELQLVANKICFIHQGKILKEVDINDLNKEMESKIMLETPQTKKVLNLVKSTFNLDGVIISEGKIELSQKELDLKSLVELLFSNDIQIENISSASPNLEEYYLSLIGGKRNA